MLYYNEKYVIVLSSAYHGYYVEDLLRRNSIPNTFKRAPRAIGPSCHTAIYIQEKDLDKAMELINKVNVSVKGVYELIQIGGMYDYRKIQ
ncbi:DUF3343 domain-containing protein [Anaeromicrobium sediminis]|uniref:Putative Se/S carrier protein-like domain-containing protein n=1 Tax=Anaeromicrobium sediminis TaxID=1478221 RepID=A0A267MQA0_9FIRM|nr:DUF3343 domain-containing protein [Anaeromicrobium sediminis]PAB60910.1 hypothetical protein CCE28_00305 [Anaeromicrobium sediminis]